MPRVFTPIDSVSVDASAPHGPNTEYKISIGYEGWGDPNPVKVLKVQMVYDGKVSGRRSPSYPLNGNGDHDYLRVRKATDDLLRKHGLPV